jgi:hypothetical protein
MEVVMVEVEPGTVGSFKSKTQRMPYRIIMPPYLLQHHSNNNNTI